MRRSFSSFCRLLACLLVMTVMTSGIAMASYVCPGLASAPAMAMPADTPCAQMDSEKPVHCAEQQSGVELALEHLAAPPALAPLTTAFVMPALAPPALSFAPWWPDFPPQAGTDPPYLRTQRLRI